MKNPGPLPGQILSLQEGRSKSSQVLCDVSILSCSETVDAWKIMELRQWQVRGSLGHSVRHVAYATLYISKLLSRKLQHCVPSPANPGNDPDGKCTYVTMKAYKAQNRAVCLSNLTCHCADLN